MLFNSFGFLLFCLCAVILYYLYQGKNYKFIVQIVGGGIFIYFGGIISLTVISIVTVATFYAGLWIDPKKNEKTSRLIFLLVLLGLIANLFFFKYYNFFNDNINSLLGIWALKSPLPYLKLLLPLGISFYTFSLLGYLIDIRLENIEPEKNILSFFNYAFFFPKILAGPIERAQHFLSQSVDAKPLLVENFTEGGKLIIWGFFQKLVVADRIAIYVNSVYQDSHQQSGITLLVCALMYTFQVYADFSGYTDIARGIARLFGYNLIENFKRPLLSFSIIEFWRKWHISLSSWVNDYIFTPLTLHFRNLGVLGVIIAIFISFLIVGFWHGALWTFAVFGILQGIFITIETLTLSKRKALNKFIPKYITYTTGLLITFLLITLSLVFFRSPSIGIAFSYISQISVSGKLFIGTPSAIIYALFGIFVLLINDISIEFYNKEFFIIRSRFFLIRSLPYALLVCMILMIGVFDGGQFIYLKF
jgi:alginate O-acetyltransferase complex protein AlgI